MRTALILLAFISHLSATKAQNQTPIYTLYLLGDAGKPTSAQGSNIDVISQQLKNESSKAIIFLGDNIYPKGMPPIGTVDRIEAEAAINPQIALAKHFGNQAFFIPGNHDWAQGRKYGFEHLNRQEHYVEAALDSMNVFVPDNGCPGPVEIPLNDQITLIVLDTQWFLHGWDKPDEEQGGCENTTPVAAIQALNEVLIKNSHKRVLVATHHPMLTYGEHGGVFKPKTYWLPPGLGLIYPLYRKWIGSVQDVANPKYKVMSQAIMKTLEQYPNVIHAAGHEHSLQYATKNGVHYIVSGSGSKKTYVKQKGHAQFAQPENGFVKILFFADGTTNLQMWDVNGDLLFEKTLMQKPFVMPITEQEFAAKHNFVDSTVKTQASTKYQASKIHQKLFGANYRDVWSKEVEIPVFDIGTEHGGLTIVQRGGGQQTKSLRLEAANGKQYVLRSIEKYAEGAIPDYLQNTFAEDLVQDQISASHPYGALVVPFLAEAANIYHTNPKVVFIPDDPRFGNHQQTFANTLALYEERPAKDWSEADFFGNSPDIENTQKVIDNLAKDNDNYIDQQFSLKSRLFDMFIGDWDRHDDQWRWAEVEDGKGNRYRPIPRDRDQAFFISEGFFPSIWTRKWALPKFEGFDHNIDWPSGLMFNARYFDRSFLTGLSKQDWINAAEELKNSLTDEVIEEAISQWPPTIFELHGEEIIAKLKSRREKLTQYAIDHYLFLAKEVDVVGSNKHEHFKAERLANGDVTVTVRKMNKEGDKKKELFQRTFKYDETNEIRLYGLDGNDEFEIEGESKRGIKIRIIGGEGEDELDDDSKVAGWGKRNIFYDTKEDNKLKLNTESKNKLSDNPSVNDYNRKAFKYNVLMPLIMGNFNPDDGLFLGGGFSYTHHGFRKEPFKSKHKVVGSYALNTSSYNFNYKGIFTDVIGHWDIETDVIFNVPNFVNNFFGMGNESRFNQNIDEVVNVKRPIDYYRLRFQEIAYEVALFKQLGAFGKIGFTQDFVSWELDQTNDEQRFVTEEFLPSAGSTIQNETTVNYLGGGLRLDVDTRKDLVNPKSGILWQNKINTLYGIDDATDDFHQFNTSLSVYHSFKLPARLTFAARVGYGMNFGDYPFFRAQTLGGRDQIRGYRKTRFYGDEAFYSNIEMRMKLFSFKSYLFPASAGILGFHDVGRVWLSGEDSDKWHRGIGGGFWLTPFNLAVLSTEVGVSEEETLFYVRLGFLF